tara:strand:- start:115683 stop:115820 length:138 start_codon:yes stop_codon:yes gene_type:complete
VTHFILEQFELFAIGDNDAGVPAIRSKLVQLKKRQLPVYPNIKCR